MTKLSYYWTLLLKSCGCKVTQKCLIEATREMQLLETAQELIGHYNVDYIESLEELKVEYWNVKNMREQIEKWDQDQIDLKEALDDTVAGGKEKMLKNRGGIKIRLNMQVSELAGQKDELQNTKNQLLERARKVRKAYEGIKQQLQHAQYSEADGKEQKEILEKRLNGCVSELRVLKKENDRLDEKIEALLAEIAEKETKIREEKESDDQSNFSYFSDVSDRNKKLTELLSKKANMQTELDDNIRYVGKFLFANRHNSNVVECIKSHRSLIRQAVALRNSMIMNHRIADKRVQFASD